MAPGRRGKRHGWHKIRVVEYTMTVNLWEQEAYRNQNHETGIHPRHTPRDLRERLALFPTS
jgi:hypothetical protein